MKFCKVCVTYRFKTKISFEENGVCNACIYSEKKSKLINWKKKEREFLTLVKKIKDEDNSENHYNCLVPWSGGKDSFLLLLNLNLNLV